MEILEEQGTKQRVGYKNPPKEYQWKKGVSANPGGRPVGVKSLKQFAREYLQSLPDDEKIDYLETLPTEIIWKMAEGNPDTKNDNNVTLTMSEVIKAAQNAKRHKPTTGQGLETPDPLPDKGQGEQPDNLPAQQSPNTLQPAQMEPKFNPQESPVGV